MSDDTLAARVEQIADAIIKQGRALSYVVSALGHHTEQLDRIEAALKPEPRTGPSKLETLIAGLVMQSEAHTVLLREIVAKVRAG